MRAEANDALGLPGGPAPSLKSPEASCSLITAMLRRSPPSGPLNGVFVARLLHVTDITPTSYARRGKGEPSRGERLCNCEQLRSGALG